MAVTRDLQAPLVALVLAALCLTSCGSDGADADGAAASDRSSASTREAEEPGAALSVPPGTPECDDVWKAGATLPRSYDGCVDEDGQFVPRDALACSSGQRIIRFDDRFYGVPGGTVHEVPTSLEQDREYRAAVLRCRA